MSNPYRIMAPSSLYIHVPFCKAKCLYCDFVSFAGLEVRQADYFQALRNELRAQAGHLSEEDKLVPLKSLYFGGGTPSAVPAEEIARVIELVKTLWGIREDCEITLEANPGSADSEGLARLYDAGVNRLSVGLQTTNDKLLRRIGRIHNLADFLRTIEAAHAVGFRNISVDLMIGLPGQTIEDVEESVKLLLDLSLKNVSFYSLIIEEGTPFYNMQREGRMQDLPDEDSERGMYELARQLLEKAGFYHYEVSNSSLHGYEGQHNLVYWKGEPYAACGLAAAAYLDGIRYLNTGNLEDYIRIYSDEHSAAFQAVVEKEIIDDEEAKLEFFLLGFRLLEGIDLADFRYRFREEPPVRVQESLARLEMEGMIESLVGEVKEKKELYRLTRHGLDVANFVFMEFV